MINALKVSSKAFLAALLIHPQLSLAEGFTSADVLKWEEGAQDSFFQTSISMASIVAARTGQHSKAVECINEWYGAEGAQVHRHDYIRSKMRRYLRYHPQGIILAVLEEECGSFTR